MANQDKFFSNKEQGAWQIIIDRTKKHLVNNSNFTDEGQIKESHIITELNSITNISENTLRGIYGLRPKYNKPSIGTLNKIVTELAKEFDGNPLLSQPIWKAISEQMALPNLGWKEFVKFVDEWKEAPDENLSEIFHFNFFPVNGVFLEEERNRNDEFATVTNFFSAHHRAQWWGILNDWAVRSNVIENIQTQIEYAFESRKSIAAIVTADGGFGKTTISRFIAIDNQPLRLVYWIDANSIESLNENYEFFKSRAESSSILFILDDFKPNSSFQKKHLHNFVRELWRFQDPENIALVIFSRSPLPKEEMEIEGQLVRGPLANKPLERLIDLSEFNQSILVNLINRQNLLPEETRDSLIVAANALMANKFRKLFVTPPLLLMAVLNIWNELGQKDFSGIGNGVKGVNEVVKAHLDHVWDSENAGLIYALVIAAHLKKKYSLQLSTKSFLELAGRQNSNRNENLITEYSHRPWNTWNTLKYYVSQYDSYSPDSKSFIGFHHPLYSDMIVEIDVAEYRIWENNQGKVHSLLINTVSASSAAFYLSRKVSVEETLNIKDFRTLLDRKVDHWAFSRLAINSKNLFEVSKKEYRKIIKQLAKRNSHAQAFLKAVPEYLSTKNAEDFAARMILSIFPDFPEYIPNTGSRKHLQHHFEILWRQVSDEAIENRTKKNYNKLGLALKILQSHYVKMEISDAVVNCCTQTVIDNYLAEVSSSDLLDLSPLIKYLGNQGLNDRLAARILYIQILESITIKFDHDQAPILTSLISYIDLEIANDFADKIFINSAIDLIVRQYSITNFQSSKAISIIRNKLANYLIAKVKYQELDHHLVRKILNLCTPAFDGEDTEDIESKTALAVIEIEMLKDKRKSRVLIACWDVIRNSSFIKNESKKNLAEGLIELELQDAIPNYHFIKKWKKFNLEEP